MVEECEEEEEEQEECEEEEEQEEEQEESGFLGVGYIAPVLQTSSKRIFGKSERCLSEI